MLQHGAATVLAVDTGYGQIHHKLRTDPRVTLLERTNARLLAPGALVPHLTTKPDIPHPGSQPSVGKKPGAPGPDSRTRVGNAAESIATIRFFALDVSFISATLVLPAVVAALAPPETKWQGEAVILVKPQFEAGREHVGKGGIVRDPAAHQLAVHRVEAAVHKIGGQAVALIDSPILGMEGNREFLLHARFA
jgi:23S rRNA (cytidine1920-2'-O)/16S rRNA (cytidine1409-2'-O)-methyltransferase